ncbi:MAG: hypothetical protein WAO98_06670 [Alphaproteobacteria bacterium]
MSVLELFKGIAIIYGIAYLLSALAAHAEDHPRLMTIADCPAGYVLGIQETSEPHLMAKKDVPAHTSQADDFKESDEAPRRFVTGCIPQPSHSQER